jgi:hypothetical protein
VLELLIGPEAPTPEEAYHWLFVSSTFGSAKLLHDVLVYISDKPVLRRDLLCGLLYDALNRLVE